MVLPALLAIQGGMMIMDVIVSIQKGKEAGRIDEETYRRLMQAAEEYQAEMEGLLPPGTVDPIEWQQFTKDVEKFVPEAAAYVPEKTPQQVTESGSAEERQAQKEALRQFGQLAKTGYDPIAEAQQEAALAASAAQASSARQSALREAAQRGLGGTGLDVLAGLGAAEQAAVSGRQAALQAQAEAGQRRLQALSQYGSMAGQMREQATGVEKGNVDIMNAFNERAARNLNQYNRYVSEMKNEANLFNLKNQQARDEARVTQANQQMLEDARRKEEAERERRDAEVGLAKDKYKIKTGLTQTWGEKESRSLGRKYAPYEKISSGVQNITGKAITGGMSGASKSYYDANPDKNPFSFFDDEE